MCELGKTFTNLFFSPHFMAFHFFLARGLSLNFHGSRDLNSFSFVGFMYMFCCEMPLHCLLPIFSAHALGVCACVLMLYMFLIIMHYKLCIVNTFSQFITSISTFFKVLFGEHLFLILIWTDLSCLRNLSLFLDRKILISSIKFLKVALDL